MFAYVLTCGAPLAWGYVHCIKLEVFLIKKISKNHFKEQLKHVLVEGIVPEIAKDDIHEFYIEGNYFYKITDKYINNIHDWLNNYFQLNI